MSDLSAGSVPAATDLVPVGQAGANRAITYAAFMAGLPGLPGVDASHISITPRGSDSSLGRSRTWPVASCPLPAVQMQGTLVLAAGSDQDRQATPSSTSMLRPNRNYRKPAAH